MTISQTAPGGYRIEFQAPRPPAGDTSGWVLTETAFNPATQGHAETIFTVGNGQQCLRGSLEEHHPGQSPAAFMHRVWDGVPLAVSELANLPRWWGIDLWLDGQRFGQDQGQVSAYCRTLDLRDGTLRRTLTWTSPAGCIAELDFERFIDRSHPARAAVRLSFKVDRAALVRLRCPLDGRVENKGLIHLDVTDQGSGSDHVWLATKTRTTGLEVAVVAKVSLTGEGPAGSAADSTDQTLWPRGVDRRGTDADATPACEQRFWAVPGVTYRLTKYVAIVPSYAQERTLAAAWQAAQQAAEAGWDQLARVNATAWLDFWTGSDVVIDGDLEAQLALRHAIFQLAIAAPKWTSRASIGAKTLSGFGYHHHVFWDTEIFMLPLFTFTQPAVARNMLEYRHQCLGGARAKAKAAGLRGAAFAWESAADGAEVTPAWTFDPFDRTKLRRIWNGERQLHITADVAYAVMQYWRATGEDRFMLDKGAEIVLDGASFWASAAQQEADGRFHLRGVVAADGYHERVDNNAFTNLMAAWHLRTGLDLAQWLATNHPQRWSLLASGLELDPDWLSHWDQVATNLVTPAVGPGGVLEEFAGYFTMAAPDFAMMRSPSRTQSIEELLGLDGVAKTQVIKQPDVLMAAYLLPDIFGPSELKTNVDYYDQRTDHEHGSSLGPAISAIMARRVGRLDLAYQHFMRAARADLLDVRHNAGDGIHGASAGGLWQAVVFGFAGVHWGSHGGLEARPALPPNWRRLEVNLTHLGQTRRLVIQAT